MVHRVAGTSTEPPPALLGGGPPGPPRLSVRVLRGNGSRPVRDRYPFSFCFVMTNSILSILAQGQTGLQRPGQRPLQALLQGQAAAGMPTSRPASGVPLASSHATARHASAGNAGGSSSPPGQRRGPCCRVQPIAAPSWEELLGRR